MTWELQEKKKVGPAGMKIGRKEPKKEGWKKTDVTKRQLDFMNSSKSSKNKEMNE